MNRALFDRNANACEAARHPKCECPCGRALMWPADARYELRYHPACLGFRS